MKPTIKTVLFISIFYHSFVGAKEFSGVWASNCDASASVSVLWIIRAFSDGLYQIGHPRINMSKPTAIVGNKDFVILSDEKLIYKNIEYNRCIASETPEYSVISETQIKTHLLGEWGVVYQALAGRKNNISNGRAGIPDLIFNDKERAAISIKKVVQPILYEIEGDTVLLKIEEGQKFKVLLINERELHITSEQKPSAGVIVYYRY